MLRLRPLGHLSADKIRYNIACARGECKQENCFFEKNQNIPPGVPNEVGLEEVLVIRPDGILLGGSKREPGHYGIFAGDVLTDPVGVYGQITGMPGPDRHRNPSATRPNADSKLACDLCQSGEHGGTFGRGQPVQELFTKPLDAFDAFIEQRLAMRGERDLNRAPVFGVLDALEEILFHEGFDEFGHGRGRELHGFRKLLQRDAARFFLGQAADKRHRLMLADADVDGGQVSDAVDRFTKCVVKARYSFSEDCGIGICHDFELRVTI